MRSASVFKNIRFLNENKIEFLFRKNGGNVVTAEYLGDTFYIGLEQFKFRKAGTNKWVQKTHRIFDLNDTIKIPRGFNSVPKHFRNKKVKYLIENNPKDFEEFLYTSPVLFTDSCLKEINKGIDLNDSYNLNFVMPFGKYQGIKLQRIAERDIQYLEWLYVNLEDKPEITNKVEAILDKNNKL